MTQGWWFRVSGLAAISLMLGLSMAAQGDPAALQQRLNAQFRPTTTTADRTDIVTAGDVVTIHKSNLVMFAGTAVPATNNYKNGGIGQGFGTILIMSNPNTVQRTFVPEEKCWVTGVQVQKDGVIFHLYSDPYNGIRYYGDLKISFPNKKEVPPVDVALGLIAEVLTVVPSDDQDGQPEPAPAQGGGASRMRGRFDPDRPAFASAPEAAPAPPPMPAIAPPPPPADAPPPTIAIDQTKDQVTAAFGQPLRVAKLGVKEIFYYKDMKVTFKNGKVIDVE